MMDPKNHSLQNVILPPEPDFNPDECLANSLKGKEVYTGITIDSKRTQIIDDGFWIARDREGGGWIVRTHIADVPAIIPDRSDFARKVADNFGDPQTVLKQKQGKQQIRNFPFDLLNQFISLHEGQTRPVLTFTTKLDYEFRLKDASIDRSAFTSLRQCDYQPLGQQLKFIADSEKGWYKLAYRMLENRLYDMGRACDAIAGYDDNIAKALVRSIQPKEHQSEMLVQELMRLTNSVASDFFAANKLPTVAMPQGRQDMIEYVSNDFGFEREADDLAWKIIQDYSDACNPKVRVTSPMRLYSDYVTMQILSGHLNGKSPSAHLIREAGRLTGIFKAAADDKPLTPERQRKICDQRLVEQNGVHPFDAIGHHPSEAVSMRLKQLERPEMAVRRLIMQGGYVYLVGMLSAQGRRKSWGVSHNYDAARELASSRMLMAMGQPIPNLP